MNKIKGIFHITLISPEKFKEELNKVVNMLQEDGQQVQVQYSSNYGQDIEGKMVYSALVIGRVND